MISLFVILAVYQTGKLWFGDFSSHNFFYDFLNTNQEEQEQSQEKFLIENIIVSSGENNFRLISEGIYEDGFKNNFDEMISYCLKKNNRKDVDLRGVFNGKLCMYNYGAYLNTEDIKDLFSHELKQEDLSAFNKIALWVDNKGEAGGILVINSDNNTYIPLNCNKKEILRRVYDDIGNLNQRVGDNYYISTYLSGFGNFNDFLFIPQLNLREYSPVNAFNPLVSENGVLIDDLEKNIDVFFDNPAIKWSSNINNVYTYSDENTVVKYYTTGVLEYINYRNIASRDDVNFYNAYLKAVNFIERDSNIVNEVFLKKYEKTDNTFKFYFDYKINDFPVELSEEIKQQTGIDAIIEISVNASGVTAYKKYAYNYVPSDNEIETLKIDYLQAVDTIFEEEGLDEKIKEIYLCYLLRGDKPCLVWNIQKGDTLYNISTD